MPLPTPPPDAASAAEPAAWAVFDGSGRKWAAYSNIGEAEWCAENWNTPRVRKDYGPVQPCHVVPLYTADVPALLSRIARAESALAKVIAHTAYLPGCERVLLTGLLASCERIARSALTSPAAPGTGD